MTTDTIIVVNRISKLHQQENKSFIEFIKNHKSAFKNDNNSAYTTLRDGKLPKDYHDVNVCLSNIPFKAMILIRYIIEHYEPYIDYIDLNGFPVKTNVSEIEIGLKNGDTFVDIYVPISYYHYDEYDESLVYGKADPELNYVNTWYLPRQVDIQPALNEASKKLKKFEKYLGRDN